MSSGAFTALRSWLCTAKLWHRRRSLQAPATPGLLAARAFGPGSGIAFRRYLAGVKATPKESR